MDSCRFQAFRSDFSAYRTCVSKKIMEPIQWRFFANFFDKINLSIFVFLPKAINAPVTLRGGVDQFANVTCTLQKHSFYSFYCLIIIDFRRKKEKAPF